jgi:hypothetical protein
MPYRISDGRFVSEISLMAWKSCSATADIPASMRSTPTSSSFSAFRLETIDRNHHVDMWQHGPAGSERTEGAGDDLRHPPSVFTFDR